jgi:hypothetical protein
MDASLSRRDRTFHTRGTPVASSSRTTRRTRDRKDSRGMSATWAQTAVVECVHPRRPIVAENWPARTRSWPLAVTKLSRSKIPASVECATSTMLDACCRRANFTTPLALGFACAGSHSLERAGPSNNSMSSKLETSDIAERSAPGGGTRGSPRKDARAACA